MNPTPSPNNEVKPIFDSYPEPIREKLLFLRKTILDVASNTKGVGNIQETLKWGQISYLTAKPKSGTTIRIDEYNRETQQVMLLVHCQTTLVDMFRSMYPDSFSYEGTRAVIIDTLDNHHIDVLRHFIELALTYHQRKNRNT